MVGYNRAAMATVIFPFKQLIRNSRLQPYDTYTDYVIYLW